MKTSSSTLSLHAGLVTEDRTAGAGEVGSIVSTATLWPWQIAQDRAPRRGRLADPGHARDPDPDRLTGFRQRVGDQLLGVLLVIGPAAFQPG